MPNQRKRITLEYDWDPQRTVLVRNKSGHNILLDLPTGYFRLDAGRTFCMTPEVTQIPQVKKLIKAGQIEVSQ